MLRGLAERSPLEDDDTGTLTFCGYDWSIKSSTRKVGPGPNRFSDSKKNVWVDAMGRLHLRITKDEEQHWQCAEVISTRSFGYGTYRFVLDTPAESLDANVVLGLFTWSDDPESHHREIDVELSRWGNEESVENAQFVIQPYTRRGNRIRFAIPPGQLRTTHSFTWAPGSVSCDSIGAPKPDEDLRRIKQWSFTRGIPEPGDENARINLWLLGGRAPKDGKECEVIVAAFEHTPLDTPKQSSPPP